MQFKASLETTAVKAFQHRTYLINMHAKYRCVGVTNCVQWIQEVGLYRWQHTQVPQEDHHKVKQANQAHEDQRYAKLRRARRLLDFNLCHIYHLFLPRNANLTGHLWCYHSI